jgi:hypothetical protein
MAKQTRRERKELREKRERAQSQGLPVSSVVVRRERGDASRASEPTDSGVDSTPATVSDRPSSSSGSIGGWSTWPISVRVLLVGIVMLIAIGLYRRYTERTGGSPPPATSSMPNP